MLKLLQMLIIDIIMVFFVGTGIATLLCLMFNIPFVLSYGVWMTILIMLVAFFMGVFGIKVRI